MVSLLAPRACLIGHPVAHSRSPLIHGHWLAQHGIDGAYGLEDVPPGGLAAFLKGMGGAYAGANVTVPHKVEALGLSARATPGALAVGAANTLWFEDGALMADNTDVAGFLAHLDEAAPGWDARPRRALVLGAGGAARAVLHGLIGRGVEAIGLVNRDLARAAALRERFGAAVEPASWAGVEAGLHACDLLVNTTSLGMAGQPPLRLALGALPPHAIVVDIVYAPLETDLLRAARGRGLLAVDGLGMLLHQAAPAFERWFGVRPSVTPALRALVEASIPEASIPARTDGTP